MEVLRKAPDPCFDSNTISDFLFFCIYFLLKNKQSEMVFESNQRSGAFRSTSIGIASKNEYECGTFQPM